MQHVFITGRGVPQGLIDIADSVSEINLVKYTHQAGIEAVPGIEW